MKKIIFISMLVVSLLSARQVFPETDKAMSVKANSYNILNVDNNTNENTLEILEKRLLFLNGILKVIYGILMMVGL